MKKLFAIFFIVLFSFSFVFAETTKDDFIKYVEIIMENNGKIKIEDKNLITYIQSSDILSLDFENNQILGDEITLKTKQGELYSIYLERSTIKLHNNTLLITF